MSTPITLLDIHSAFASAEEVAARISKTAAAHGTPTVVTPEETAFAILAHKVAADYGISPDMAAHYVHGVYTALAGADKTAQVQMLLPFAKQPGMLSKLLPWFSRGASGMKGPGLREGFKSMGKSMGAQFGKLPAFAKHPASLVGAGGALGFGGAKLTQPPPPPTMLESIMKMIGMGGK